MELYTNAKENPPFRPSGRIVKYVQFKEFPHVKILATKKESPDSDLVLIEIWRGKERVKGVRYNKKKFNLYILDNLLIWYYMEFIYGKEGRISKRNLL